jgi:hypothetical protein
MVWALVVARSIRVMQLFDLLLVCRLEEDYRHVMPAGRDNVI